MFTFFRRSLTTFNLNYRTISLASRRVSLRLVSQTNLQQRYFLRPLPWSNFQLHTSSWINSLFFPWHARKRSFSSTPERYPFTIEEFRDVDLYISELLQGRRDINAQSRAGDTYQNTFLMHLLAYEHIEGAETVLEAALQNKIQINPKLIDSNGRTLLMQAILVEAKNFISRLLQNNECCFTNRFDINKMDYPEITAEDSLEFTNRVSSSKGSGFTALHYAFLMRDFATARRLLELGADLNAVDAKGRTPEDLLNKENEEEVSATLASFGIDSERDAMSISNFLLAPTDLPLRNPLRTADDQSVRAIKNQIPSFNELYYISLAEETFGEEICLGMENKQTQTLMKILQEQIMNFSGQSLAESIYARTEEFQNKMREFVDNSKAAGLTL